ncbi:MAG: hypothetical protein ILO34_05930, partial [Kiritimatiellae bacterium]|nr:hypothetical protein [Kiritimatiellia bacterium]
IHYAIRARAGERWRGCDGWAKKTVLALLITASVVLTLLSRVANREDSVCGDVCQAYLTWLVCSMYAIPFLLPWMFWGGDNSAKSRSGAAKVFVIVLSLSANAVLLFCCGRMWINNTVDARRRAEVCRGDTAGRQYIEYGMKCLWLSDGAVVYAADRDGANLDFLLYRELGGDKIAVWQLSRSDVGTNRYICNFQYGNLLLSCLREDGGDFHETSFLMQYNGLPVLRVDSDGAKEVESMGEIYMFERRKLF